MTPYFPMYFNLKNKKILVIGAGNIAVRRIDSLRRFGADITIVAKEISEKLKIDKDIKVIEREFQENDLDIENLEIAIIATNNSSLNEQIADMCSKRNIMKNVSTNQNLCDFFFPATIMTDEVVVGICSGGADPSVTKRTRQRIQKLLEEEKNE